MLKTVCMLSLIFAISFPIGAVDGECLASDGTFLKVRGCCNGVKYEARPTDPKLVNPYEIYEECCADQIVEEFDSKTHKCCREGSWRGRIIPVTQSCN